MEEKRRMRKAWECEGEGREKVTRVIWQGLGGGTEKFGGRNGYVQVEKVGREKEEEDIDM